MITGGRITSVVLNKGKSLSLPLLWGSNMSCALNASFMSFYSTTFLSLTNAISSSSLGEYFNKVPHLLTSLTLGWWWLRETMINPLCCSLPLRNVCWFCPLFQLTLHCKMAANSGSETKHCNCTLITPQHSIIKMFTTCVDGPNLIFVRVETCWHQLHHCLDFKVMWSANGSKYLM